MMKKNPRALISVVWVKQRNLSFYDWYPIRLEKKSSSFPKNRRSFREKNLIFLSKLLKIDENDENAYFNIFQGTIDMVVIVFVGCYIYPLGHFSP